MPQSTPAETTACDIGDADVADEAASVEAARHDRRAFAPLYRRYVDGVYRFCRRRLATREEAEDATSQVFTKALGALDAYRGDSFRAWLFAIAANVVADRHRARRPVHPLADAANVRDADATPEELALAEAERFAVGELLARLSDEQRRVVELRLSGLNGAEIADLLGKNRAAVDALQYRAVVRLRTLLARRDEDEDKRHERR